MGTMTRRAWPLLILAVALPLGCTTLWPFTAPPAVDLPVLGDAPPTAATDADGRPMSLAAHRGKVVLLSFWHSQCPPCKAMFPHEKELVAKLAGAPFVLLGVNADPSPHGQRQSEHKHGLSWQSFWDGPHGAICHSWRVEGFPTLVLIDQSGKVRWRQTGAPSSGVLEGHIARLLAESPDPAK